MTRTQVHRRLHSRTDPAQHRHPVHPCSYLSPGERGVGVILPAHLDFSDVSHPRLWSMLSCCLAATHSPGAVYAIRFVAPVTPRSEASVPDTRPLRSPSFLQALFESSTVRAGCSEDQRALTSDHSSPARTGSSGLGTRTLSSANVRQPFSSRLAFQPLILFSQLFPCTHQVLHSSPAALSSDHSSPASCKARFTARSTASKVSRDGGASASWLLAGLLLTRHSFRWAFIIDGIIGLVIAFYGFCVFPNTPRTTKAFYLTQEERELALSRIPERPHEKLTWRAAWGCIKGWRYWCFSALFTVSSQLEAYGTNGIVRTYHPSSTARSRLTRLRSYMAQDDRRQRAEERLLRARSDLGRDRDDSCVLASGLRNAALIRRAVICGLMTDIFGHRWRVNIFMGVALIISASMLLVWDIGLGARQSSARKAVLQLSLTSLFAEYFAFCSPRRSVSSGVHADVERRRSWRLWLRRSRFQLRMVRSPSSRSPGGRLTPSFDRARANELSRSDVERSFILYSMNMWSNAFTAWIIIVIWPVVSAPRYRRGFIFTLPMAVLTMLIAVGTEVAWRRKVRGKKQAVDGESLREKEKEKVERGAAEEKEEVAEAEVANGKGNGHEAEKEDARSDEKHDLSTDTKEHA